MSQPRISVVVPSLDRPSLLDRCVRALADGSVSPHEVVVVDQSGGVEIAAVCRRLAGDLRIVRLERPARGLSAARNEGVRASSGTVVAFTDEDCLPDRNWLDALSGALGTDRSLGGVAGPMLPLPPSGDRTQPASSRTGTHGRMFSGRTLPWHVGTGGNLGLRREWLERIGGYDERLGAGSRGRAGEDIDLIRRLLAAGARLAYEPSALCNHERKTPAERCASRWSYGYGAGACCGRWLHDGDPYALVAIGGWLTLRVQLAARGAIRGDIRVLAEEARVVVATLGGFAYGVRLGSWAAS